MADADPLEDIREEVRGLRALIQKRQHAIPSEAQWTLDEARVRLSHGINAKALTEEELEAWLDDRRTMSEYALMQLRKDELCPIYAISVGGCKRIPEKLIRRHLREQREEGRPESLKQI